MNKIKTLLLILIFLTYFGVCCADIYNLGTQAYHIENGELYSYSSGKNGNRMYPYRMIVRKYDHSIPTEMDFSLLSLSGIVVKPERLLADYFILEIDKNENPFLIAASLYDDMLFEYIEFDVFGHFTSDSTNDVKWDDQWGLQADKLQMLDAWDISTGASSVIVGNIDSGVDFQHEDLVGNIWQNLGEDADNDNSVLVYVNGEWQFDPGDINGVDDDSNGKVDDLVG